ncbi:hypothetical protein BJ322DRAFT_1103798 [Thelephora terrestris]|uniref:BTB domain-containing protein n=1 Tax=Thelephora terrestris TaxID=56493 RepID=A0A9P6HSC2_9AGAM|nr:hypothetical protein BJ322DRAFT_1103798 [Thelephora terrestris]
MDIPEPLQQALGDSIISGKFIDTKVWAFSSRNRRTGRVANPQPLYVNRRVLGSLPPLQHVLYGEDDVDNMREGFPDLLEPFSDDYDYSSDSDFDIDDEESGPPGVEEPQAMVRETRLREDTPAALDNEKCGDILHSEKEDAQSETSGTMSASEMEFALAEAEDTNQGIAGPKNLAKTVIIHDVAFFTLRAALQYLYTNDIEFAPPARSNLLGDSESRSGSPQTPLPSPKSVYRLAAKYNILGLRMAALDEIKRTLDSCDIIEELFSKFTSCFPEIMEVQVEHLARNLLSSIEPWKTAALKRKIEVYTSGALPHAKEVLPALYHRLANPRLLSMRTPHQFQMPHRGDFDWRILKRELTKSLSTGVFLNIELHAPESRSSSGQLKLRPLYFCGAAGGEYTTKILSCVKDTSSERNEALDNVYNLDSDVEIEVDEISEYTESTGRHKHMQARSILESSTPPFGVLGVGAWRTWKAVLYYLYTNKITFGRLSSQPPVSMAEVGCRQAGSFQLPPTSPKSVYTLACTIGLQSLRGLAFENFKSGIDSTNVTQELLSPFSARHTTIRTMLLRLFETGLKSSGNEELFIDSLRTSSDGRTPHRGAAIGLVFERLVEEGRRVLSPSVKPRPSSTFASVTLAATNTTTTMTKTPPDTGSSNGCGGGGVGSSETAKMSSVGESGKLRKSSKKKLRSSERPHSPPCRCEVCKRAGKASKKSSLSVLPS